MLANRIIEVLEKEYCLTLDEIQERLQVHRSLVAVYLSKLWEDGKIIKKRKYIGKKRLTIYCLNDKKIPSPTPPS